MSETVLASTRRRCGWVGGLFFAGALAWWLSPGLPVIWGPSASAEEKQAGRALFVRDWEPRDPVAHGDGLGPVFNARSCVACHFQGGVGGGGGNDHNVTAFEAMPTRDRPRIEAGLIHKYAVLDPLVESHETLRRQFPIINDAVTIEGGCQILVRDFDPIRVEHINTTALFGAGWLDRLDGKAIVTAYRNRSLNQLVQELKGEFKSVPPGRPRVLADGRLGKFGWKAQFATLQEFVAAACANEIGLGNPIMSQADPRADVILMAKQDPDLDERQFRALVAYVDTLPRPHLVQPNSREEREAVERGEQVFAKVGCALCHTPDVGGVRGIYSDFLLHRLADRSKAESGYVERVTPQIPLPEEHPLPDEWKTPPLWGVADSAPYWHDGSAATLESALGNHHGDAQGVTDHYNALDNIDREALLGFLRSLKAPVEAEPALRDETGPLVLK
jgi:mono/diheme cytochrome c family protein